MHYVVGALALFGAGFVLWFLCQVAGAAIYLWESREDKKPATYKIDKEDFKLSINVNRPDDTEGDADETPVYDPNIPPTRAEVVGDTIRWIVGCALAAWIVYLVVTH